MNIVSPCGFCLLVAHLSHMIDDRDNNNASLSDLIGQLVCSSLQ